MPVVVVVAVAPCVKGVVDVDAKKLPDPAVEAKGGKEGEMRHIVKLYEDADGVEGVKGPPDDAEIEVDERDGSHLVD